MIGVVLFFLVFIIIGLIAGIFNTNNYFETKSGSKKLVGKQIVKVFAILFLSLALSSLQPFSIQRIDAGYVGLKIDRVGNQKGIPQVQPVKGWVLYNSWLTDVVEYTIRQNHVNYEPFTVTTKGGFPMTVQPSYNYALKPDKAAELYIHLLRGESFSSLENNFLSTATQLALNNASNKFPIDSIFNNKEGYNIEVSTELNKELSDYFVVTQINPGSQPPAELAEVIKSKTETVQRAQQAELDKITAQAEAATKIAKAKGDSAAVVIAAKAEAEAIKLKQREINAAYVEFIKAQKWDGKLPEIMSGNSSGFMVNLPAK